MRFALSAVLALLAGSVALAGKKDPVLTPHTSDAGRYTAAFPDRPKLTAHAVPTAAGELRVSSDTATSKDLALAVTWTDYPASFAAIPPEVLYAAVKEGMRPKDATVAAEKTVPAADPNPAGREVLFNAGKHHVRARLFLVGRRLYQVTAIGPRADVEGELAGKFLASFQVTGR